VLVGVGVGTAVENVTYEISLHDDPVPIFVTVAVSVPMPVTE
jgi:hypothetical protein